MQRGRRGKRFDAGVGVVRGSAECRRGTGWAVHRSLKVAAVAAAALLLITSCGSGDDSADPAEPAGGGGEPNAGGTLRVGLYQPLDTFNPFTNFSGEQDAVVLGQIYDSLFTISSDGATVEPMLATGYEASSDGLTYTIGLQEGLKFNNGDDVTAADVVFSLTNSIDSPTSDGDLAAIESVEASDDGSVVLRLSHPDSELTRALTSSGASIVPEGFAGLSEEEIETNPIGTGPFVVVDHTIGSEIRMAPNEHYWGDAPLLDEIVYTTFADVNAATLAYQAGDVDILALVPDEAMAAIGVDPIEVTPSSRTQFLMLNAESSRVGQDVDVNVRRAISLALDREAIVDGLSDGRGAPAERYLAPAVVPDADMEDVSAAYELDPDEASELLDGSGLTDGPPLRLTYSSFPAFDLLAEVLQAQLAESGIEIEIQPLEPEAKRELFAAGGDTWDLSLGFNSGATSGHFLSFQIGTQWAGANWEVDTTSELLERYQAVDPEDAEGQAEVLSEWERYVADEVPVIPLNYLVGSYVVAERVQGFSVNPFQDAPFEAVSVSD